MIMIDEVMVTIYEETETVFKNISRLFLKLFKTDLEYENAESPITKQKVSEKVFYFSFLIIFATLLLLFR